MVVILLCRVDGSAKKVFMRGSANKSAASARAESEKGLNVKSIVSVGVVYSSAKAIVDGE